jgi:1-acyl-sn-glycerol-3-phosphate acyltransferase
VARDGQDTAALRALLSALRRGRVVGMAAEGRRSRSGRLGEVHPVLARLAVRAGVPVVPVGIGGSFEALPPGAWLPRRRPIRIRVGAPLRFDRETSGEVAAGRIREAIAALLPPEQRPSPDLLSVAPAAGQAGSVGACAPSRSDLLGGSPAAGAPRPLCC